MMKSLLKQWCEPLLSGIRRRFSEREEAEALAYLIREMLAVPAREATMLARACAARRAKLQRLCASGRPKQRLQSLKRMHLPLDVGKAARTFEAYSSPVNLLSLPFTASSIHLLVHLFHSGRRQFRFLNTPPASKYLRPLIVDAEDGGGVFLSSTEMVEHSRGRRGEERPATTYVTFPDHQLTRGDTMWRTQFLDEDYQFSTLEPLLFLRGCVPLLTLGVETAGGRARLNIIPYPAQPPVGGGAEADVSALLKWLGERMSAVFRHAPADVVSWEYVYARSYRTRARNTVMKLKEVEGYIQSWRSTDARLNAETYAWSVKELRELQGALHGSAPRPRATLS